MKPTRSKKTKAKSDVQGYALPASFTIDNAETVSNELVRLLQAGTVSTLDASKVEILTTPGIQLLVSLAQTLTQRGEALTVLHPSAAFAEAFKAAGLETYLTNHEEKHG